MSFALVAFHARGVEITSPSNKRGIQQVVLDITATANDVDLDIGDDGGTFWTAAIADATYGDLATEALEILQSIVAQSAAFMSCSSQQMIDRVQVASLTTTGQYTLAVQDSRPNIAVDAADGETSWKLILTYEMDNFIQPIYASLGAQDVQ